MRLAEQVHGVVGARHLSRVDMIVQANGDPVVLEINSIPGMTPQSLYPRSAEFAGHKFSELMQKFVELVKRDYKLN
jgi:D-alanine-D-alanine ligase